MKQYLATTALSEIWDTKGQVLLLGPWCLSGANKGLLEGRDYELLPSPWKPALKLKEAADYCYAVYLDLLKEIAGEFNHLHGVSYPPKYWQTLAGPWLLSFIKIVYERYKRIENSVRLFPDAYTHVLAAECCDLATYDTREFMADRINSDAYNFKIFSLANYALRPRNLITIEGVPETKSLRTQYIPNLKTRIFNAITKNLFSGSSTVLVDMYHLRNIDRLSLTLRSGVGFTDFFDTQRLFPQEAVYEPSLRKKIKLTGSGDRFRDFINRIIPSAIPKCYIEDFKKFHEYMPVVKRSGRNVRAVGSAVGWFYNEMFKFFAAQLSGGDTKFIEFQHGGGYGLFLSTLQERTAKEKDVFYTWGINPENDRREAYLPSPHLSRLKDTYCPKDERVLFISMGVPRYAYRFSTFLQPEDMPRYFEDERIFIGSLQKDLFKQFLYRPYPIDYGWGQIKALEGLFPGIQVLKDGDLMEYLKRVRLTVINHPHTSFLEALVINVPSIFYWDHSVYLMREGSEEYLEPLRKAGVLYRDPKAAAEKANQVYAHPLDWWLSPEVQKAREHFCRRYAYADQDWLKAWSNELGKYGKNTNA
ncbi:MAG: LIC12162 family protein [Candidatus Omnitrophica bacterium]|nr:LIC12162 family protein [Candidatus Omnitrophota bacterium]